MDGSPLTSVTVAIAAAPSESAYSAADPKFTVRLLAEGLTTVTCRGRGGYQAKAIRTLAATERSGWRVD